MVKCLPGRTENRIKNRFNCLYKKAREELTFSSKKYDIEEALNQLEKESLLMYNEEDIIEYLIMKKKEQIEDSKLNRESIN
jgi:hypothetical protein